MSSLKKITLYAVIFLLIKSFLVLCNTFILYCKFLTSCYSFLTSCNSDLTYPVNDFSNHDFQIAQINPITHYLINISKLFRQKLLLTSLRIVCEIYLSTPFTRNISFLNRGEEVFMRQAECDFTDIFIHPDNMSTFDSSQSLNETYGHAEP